MSLKLGSTGINKVYLGSTEVNSILLGVTSVYSTASAFTPADLFASGEEGVWYDIHPDYLFQNSNGTGAVTVGDPVGYVTDRSGNGNHLLQSVSADRPVLRQTVGGLYYLEFNGTNYGMETATIDFTATDKVSVFVGAERESDHFGMIAETSTNSSNTNGSFGVWTFSTNSYIFRSRGTAPAGATASGYTASHKAVLTGLGDISGDSAIIRVDGVQVAEDTTDQGSGNYTSQSLYVGYRDANFGFLDGRIFSLIIRGAASSAQEISDSESYVADKTGVTL